MASAFNTTEDYRVEVEVIIGYSFVLASYICLVLPLSLYVLYLGFLQLKSKRTDSSWSIGHSDFSTYNLAFMEMFGLCGFVILLHTKINKENNVSDMGSIINKLPFFGQQLFPIFTCAEHYLAVVRPVIYLNLKRSKGLWIRNVSTAIVWLLCLSATCYASVFWQSRLALLFIIVPQILVSFVAIVFCCVSVLHVLFQPKPGDQSKCKFDKSKKTAVYVITAIMSTILLRFMGSAVLCILCFYSDEWCVNIGAYIYWLNLSSSVVFFLLYLQRAGKLSNGKSNTDSEKS